VSNDEKPNVGGRDARPLHRPMCVCVWTLIFAPSGSVKCGLRPRTPRIIGGQAAWPHSWPWMCSIRFLGRSCGCSVISPNWVVTAAHCKYTSVFILHRHHNSRLIRQKWKHTISSSKPRDTCSSVLFFSGPRSKGWPHYGRTFSILSLSSTGVGPGPADPAVAGPII